MPTEITLEPAKSANGRPLSGMKEANPQAFTGFVEGPDTDLNIGSYAVGKSSILNAFVIAHYDTSSIPLGAQLTKVKVEMKASATSSLFTGNLEVAFIQDDRFNQLTRSHIDGRLRYRPLGGYSGAYQELWSNGNTGTGGTSLDYTHSMNEGIGSFAQAWSPSTNQTLTTHAWRLSRLNVGGNANTKISVNLYDAEGSAGNYTKGGLIDQSTELSWTDISSSFLTGAVSYFSTSTPISVLASKTYISEVAINRASSANGTFRAFYAYGADTEDHAALYAEAGRYMQGVVTRGVGWVSDQQIRDVALSGAGSTFAPPAFTLGQVYTFGSSGYSGGSNFTTADQMLADFQAALDARTSTDQWIGVRLKPASSQTSGRFRRIEGIESGSTAVRDGLKGLLLTTEFTPPQSAVIGNVSAQPVIDAELRVSPVIDAEVSVEPVINAEVAVSDESMLPKLLRDVERG